MKFKRIGLFGFFGAIALSISLASCGGAKAPAKVCLDVDFTSAKTMYSTGDTFTSEGLKVFTFELRGEEKTNVKETTDFELSIKDGTKLEESGEKVVTITSSVDKTIYPTSYTIDISEFIDYTENDEVRLKLDYKTPDGTNRNFYTDGISEVTVHKFIDGDTTHFKMKGKQTIPHGRSEIIKSRYYGIDTPESTGSIEPWGKKASNFTKSVLESCAEGTIVVTSTLHEYGEPEPDSTGSRYVSMIWYSEKPNASIDELRLLNLRIVQEGLSAVKGTDKYPEYEEAFLNAQIQARDLKLNLHQGLDADPDYNYGAYADTSLFDLQEDQLNLMKDPNAESIYNGANVYLTGVVAGYVDSTLYLQASRESEDGDGLEYASINIYCGMQQIPFKYQQLNTYLKVPGKVTYNPTFGFQVSDTKFASVGTGDIENGEAVILHEPTFVEGTELAVKEFDIPATQLDKNNINMFQSPISIQETVTVTGGPRKNPASDSTAVTLYIKPDGFTGDRYEYNIRLTFSYRPGMNKPNPNFVDKNTYLREVEDFVGKRFKVKGIFTAFRYSEDDPYRYQICPRVNSDLILIEE